MIGAEFNLFRRKKEEIRIFNLCHRLIISPECPTFLRRYLKHERASFLLKNIFWKISQLSGEMRKSPGALLPSRLSELELNIDDLILRFLLIINILIYY